MRHTQSRQPKIGQPNDEAELTCLKTKNESQKKPPVSYQSKGIDNEEQAESPNPIFQMDEDLEEVIIQPTLENQQLTAQQQGAQAAAPIETTQRESAIKKLIGRAEDINKEIKQEKKNPSAIARTINVTTGFGSTKKIEEKNAPSGNISSLQAKVKKIQIDANAKVLRVEKIHSVSKSITCARS